MEQIVATPIKTFGLASYIKSVDQTDSCLYISIVLLSLLSVACESSYLLEYVIRISKIPIRIST